MPFLKQILKPIYFRITGLPSVEKGEITETVLLECIGKRDPVIIEIGANDGTHTDWFRKLFPKSTIHCFEPDERASRQFRERMSGVSQVWLYEMAVGPKTGELTFYPSDSRATNSGTSGWSASGSLRRPTGHLELHPGIKFAQPITVQSIRLDDWCRRHEIENIDLIWMDVQGAELDVFAGASESLKNVRFIYTEYAIQELYEGQPTLKAILSALPDFKPLVRYSNDILLQNTSLKN